MGFFSAVKKALGLSANGEVANYLSTTIVHDTGQDEQLLIALRQAPPKLSSWLGIILDGEFQGLPRVQEANEIFWQRLSFLLQSLESPEVEVQEFLAQFRSWLKNNEYLYVEDFRSELQYRLALALDMEDEEDERDRLFHKLQNGLARTREQLGKGLHSLFAGHSSLSPAFWEELEELFIMSDMGTTVALDMVARLRNKATQQSLVKPQDILPLLQAEVEAMFTPPRRISAINHPEVVLMVGINGVGKTTTIAKLAHRAKMQGKTVLIAAADTFRAAAVEQLATWAERVGADFHSKPGNADPAAVAYEAMDKALAGSYDILFIDTAGRLHTKTNLMEELHKIQQVVAKKHPGAPHRVVLVIDATTGQNALQQTKLFKESSGVNEIIITKLDGTAKGGVALGVASQFQLPITFIGLGEKMEDLRPFDPKQFAMGFCPQDKNT